MASILALEQSYIFLLQRSMTALRLAIDEDDRAWYRAEFEFVHNVPSLIGEANQLRHRYFWDVERVTYLDWLSTQGEDRQIMLHGLYREPLEKLENAMARAMPWQVG